MPRKVKSAKPLIYVFCEGESEQAYTDYLKKTFSDVAVLKRPPDTGLFEEAEAKFSKSPKYKNSIDVTDEIWFFYDVEEKDISKWNDKILWNNIGVTIVNILDSNVNDNNTFDGLLIKISFDVRTL